MGTGQVPGSPWATRMETTQGGWQEKTNRSEGHRGQHVTVWDMDRSPPDFSIHGIFQARVLEWGAIAFLKDRDLKSEAREPWVLWPLPVETVLTLREARMEWAGRPSPDGCPGLA